MHWIERHILKRLAFNDQLRYRDLKPASVEGNLFQYHARLLEQQHLIERTRDGYTLTPAGKSFVADLSQTKAMNPHKFPRVVVMIICRNDEGQYLLFKWRRQPYRGLISFPFGRQMYELSPTAMAHEQLLFKTGFQADLKYVGHVDVISEGESEVESHLAINVFEGSQLKPVATPDGLTGEWFWGNDNILDSTRALPGMQEILNWHANTHRPQLFEVGIHKK